jgi:hypothetical protein
MGVTRRDVATHSLDSARNALRTVLSAVLVPTARFSFLTSAAAAHGRGDKKTQIRAGAAAAAYGEACYVPLHPRRA